MQWQNNTLLMMLRNLTPTSYFWILLGLLFSLGGTYFTWKWRMMTMQLPMPIGFLMIGIGMILCGLTNGFTDHSPLGRKLKRIGAFLMIVGIPPIAYVAWFF
jgi:hypothetical protein